MGPPVSLRKVGVGAEEWVKILKEALYLFPIHTSRGSDQRTTGWFVSISPVKYVVKNRFLSEGIFLSGQGETQGLASGLLLLLLFELIVPCPSALVAV
jgi:hypothetical protein